MADKGKENRPRGRNLVIVLVALCIACGGWIGISWYRLSVLGERLEREKAQLEQALPVAAEIVRLAGRVTTLPPMTEAELDGLINVTLRTSALKWRSVMPLPAKASGRSIEFVRQISIDENDISTILGFLVSLKQQRPDLAITRVNLNAVGRTRRVWSGDLDITMVQRTG